MLTWLVSGFDRYGATIDPDCAAGAAREDPETAVWLLAPDHYRAYFADQFHPSYDAAMAQIWTTFLYCCCGWRDFAPLEKGHRLKKMNAHYKAALDRCRTPDWARLELEKELTKVLVCRCQWRAGTCWRRWQRRGSRRRLPAFCGALTGMTGWRRPSCWTGRGCPTRADLLDPIHGYGARVTFDRINNGPEYNNDIVMIHGASFYRLGGMPFGDYLPQRAVVALEEQPVRFASMAGAVFKQLTGLK